MINVLIWVSALVIGSLFILGAAGGYLVGRYNGYQQKCDELLAGSPGDEGASQ